jgi:bifunctional N-acetylglucosamine-1-phosphate-uridyltransferase/glucosamine-1-phosphate-acetyltransferase GlmU-like protein
MNQIVILAAGKGTRMNSDLPKALIPLKGRPMIKYLLDSVVKSGVDMLPIIIVSPDNKEMVSQELQDYKVQYVIQDKQLGTGHAVSCVKDFINLETENIIVLYCDHPFLKSKSLQKCATSRIETVKVMTTNLTNFEDWRHNFYHWGRFVRNDKNEIERIVEFKDATPEEQLITEVNPGFMAFNSSWLWDNITMLSNNNSQHEYYLTSLPGMAFSQGYKIPSISIEPHEAMGINSQEELKIAESLI